MRVGSLFAGIGGFDLGLERAGFEIAWQVEIDPYCQRVLAKHWPHVQRYGDIKTIDWSTVEPVDLICGGFPCQPFSLAGQRRGTADDRYLWPAMLSGIQQLQPTWIIGENVPGLVGPVLDTVLADLEAAGYEVQTLAVPACAVDAPHIRQRIWILAYHSEYGRRQGRKGRSDSGGARQSGQAFQALADTECERRHAGAERPGRTERTDVSRRSAGSNVADRDGARLQERIGFAGISSQETGRDARQIVGVRGDDVEGAGCIRERRTTGCIETESGRTFSESAGSSRWEPEPELGRVAHGIPHRVDRLRGLGNAIVPQIAEWLGRQIMRVA